MQFELDVLLISSSVTLFCKYQQKETSSLLHALRAVYLMKCYCVQYETFLEREQNQQATHRTSPTIVINYHLLMDLFTDHYSKQDIQEGCSDT